MFNKVKLKNDQNVQIEFYNYMDEIVRCTTTVDDVQEDRIVLLCPIVDRLPVFIPVGTNINVYFWDACAFYKFTTCVLEVVKGHVPLIIISKYTELERIQNRQHVRVNTCLEVKLSYEDDKKEIQTIICQSRNISGGGIMLVLDKPHPLKKKDDINLDFTLNDEQIKATGVIIRTDTERDDHGDKKYILAVKFKSISEKDTQALVQYVFQKQIELRRKGLL